MDEEAVAGRLDHDESLCIAAVLRVRRARAMVACTLATTTTVQFTRD
jgi:hypothetical protein